MTLDHKNIRKIHDVGRIDGCLYYAKEYFEDYSTIGYAVFCENRIFNETEIIELIRPVALALDYAAQFDLVHGWLTPHKVILSQNTPYICLSSPYRHGSVMGNPAFASPEHLTNQELGIQSDIFSLGSIAYFMATGRLPFRENTALGLMNAILKKKPLRVTKINSDISKKMSKVIDKMMAKKLKKRYSSYRQLVEDLEK